MKSETNKVAKVGFRKKHTDKAHSHANDHNPDSGGETHIVAGSRSQNVESIDDMKEDENKNK